MENRKTKTHTRLLLVFFMVFIALTFSSSNTANCNTTLEKPEICELISIKVYQFIKTNGHYFKNSFNAKYNPDTNKIYLGAIISSIEENPHYRDVDHYSGNYKYRAKGYYFNLY
jgi:hypothetical protein